jgi:flavin-dependent dehydrogenase
LLNLYRRQQPALLGEIFRAGARELAVREALPAHLVGCYASVAGDEKCSLLLCRRATLEAVIRGQVARLSAVDILPSTMVCGVIVDGASGSPRVIGVQIKRGSETTEIFGDVIVDATGRMTRFPEWLRVRGIESVQEINEEINRAFYTRFYRLRGGCVEPTEFGRPLSVSSEYATCNVYPADNGFFSVTFGFDMQDLSLRRELRRQREFHQACETIPQVTQWVRRADAVTDVFATGGLRNSWRTYVAAGKALVCGFFAIGDALAHTNPGYGAGCSWAAEHAHVLAEALERTADPAERAFLFDQHVRDEAYPFYSFMAASDRAIYHGQESFKYLWLARKLRTPASKAIAFARAGDIVLVRWSLQRKYMMRLPRYWQDRFFLLERLLLFWIRGKWYRRGAHQDQFLARSEFLRTICSSGQGDHTGSSAT